MMLMEEEARALKPSAYSAVVIMRIACCDCCISSSLIRAKETAEIILRESGNDVSIKEALTLDLAA